MKRLVLAASAVLLSACGQSEPGNPEASSIVSPPTPQSAPAPAEPAPQSPAVPTPPAPGTSVAAMNLMCGGEPYRVAFEETRAVVLNADGSNTELPLLPPTPTSEPGVSTFTNGMMTFTRSGGRDTPTVIRFARGRMAFQDCAIAQN